MAQKEATSVLQLANDREVEYGAAFALVLSGDSYHVRRLADNLEKNFPEDTSVKFSYIPVIRRVLALNPEEPETAIGMLQNATPYELGAPRSNL